MKQKKEPVLIICEHERWGYYAAEPDATDPEESPVAWLSDKSVKRMLDRIETAGFSFATQEPEKQEIGEDEMYGANRR